MAHMPSEITVQVANLEVAAELDELADTYEEVAQKLRFQAEHLRKGFPITLQITTSQVTPPNSMAEAERIADILNPTPTSEELDGDVSDKEVKAVFDNHEGVKLLPLEPRDPEMAKQWRKGTHFLPWGNHITTCGIDTQGQVRMSWDENKGDWVHPVRPTVMKARTTAKLKYVDCPDCRDLIRDTFNEPEKSNIEWLMSGFDEDEEE